MLVLFLWRTLTKGGKSSFSTDTVKYRRTSLHTLHRIFSGAIRRWEDHLVTVCASVSYLTSVGVYVGITVDSVLVVDV